MSIPDYNRTNWENDVTDADENTMNNIEDGVEDNRDYIQSNEGRISNNEDDISTNENDISDFKDGTQSVEEANNINGINLNVVHQETITIDAGATETIEFIRDSTRDSYIVSTRTTGIVPSSSSGYISYQGFETYEDDSFDILAKFYFKNETENQRDLVVSIIAHTVD